MLNQWREKKQSFKVKDDVAGVWNTRNGQQCSHLIGDAVLHVRAEDQPDVTVLLPVQRDTRRNFNTNANRLWFTHSLLAHSHFWMRAECREITVFLWSAVSDSPGSIAHTDVSCGIVWQGAVIAAHVYSCKNINGSYSVMDAGKAIKALQTGSCLSQRQSSYLHL